MESNRYDAFISYRHLPLDKAVAIKLQYLLETYKPPKGILLKNTNRIRRIFRDESELPTSGDLGADIRSALASSSFLILICSRETVQSKWCMEEVNTFIQLHKGDTDRILTVLVDGEPHAVFPAALCSEDKEVVLPDHTIQIVKRHVEPLCTDVRAENTGKSLRKLQTEFLRIAAPILGCGFDDLYGRHKRRRQKRMIQMAAVGAVILLAGGIAASQMNRQLEIRNASIQEQQQQIAEQDSALAVQKEKIKLATIQEKAVEVEKEIEAGKRITALKNMSAFASQYREDPESYRNIKENMNWLALMANYASALNPYETVEESNSYIALSSRGNYVVTYGVTEGKTGNINIYDKHLNLKYAVPISFQVEIYNLKVYFDEDLKQITLKYQDGSIHTYDMEGKETGPAEWRKPPQESIGLSEDSTRVSLKEKTLYMDNTPILDISAVKKPDIVFSDEWHTVDENVIVGLFSDQAGGGTEYDPFQSGGVAVLDSKKGEISYIPLEKPQEDYGYDLVRIVPDGRYIVVKSSSGVYKYTLDVFKTDDGSWVTSLGFDGNLGDIRFCSQNGRMVVKTDINQQTSSIYKISMYDPDKDCFVTSGERKDYINDMAMSGDNLYILSESKLELVTLKDISVVEELGRGDVSSIDMDLQSMPEYSEEITKLTEDQESNFILNVKWQPKMLSENVWSGGIQSVEMLKNTDSEQIFNFFAVGYESVFYKNESGLFGFMNEEKKATRAFRIYSFDELVDLAVNLN